jgi:Lipoprotein LpqB beta-propeller domain/Sporulation and spore germination
MRKALVVFVAAALALTGCVGIPTSGGVQTGPLMDDQLDPEFSVLPSGPVPGSSQEEILEDFMFALSGPQNDYATARQFLTNSLAQDWDPDASAIIRTGIPSMTPGPVPDSLSYTVTSRAQVDADGLYRESDPASQTLDFTFEQQDGEWRISTAPDGIVLSQPSFNVVFVERALYFFDPSYGYLVPDVRWFPSRSTVPVRIVSALLAGPASWLQQGVVLSAFPTATTLDTARIESGTATVELSGEALSATPQERDRMRQQLAATLDVATVVMTVGGIELVTPDAGTDALTNPTVEGAVLIGTGTEFGFDTGDGISPIDGLSDKVVEAGATGATLASDNKQTITFVAPAGALLARVSGDETVVLDQRPGLITPSIDPFRFVWSVQGANAATLTTFEVDATQHPVQSALPADARIVSIDVSRDGARILLFLSTSLGPKLVVAGIIREQSTNVPTSLGEFFELPGVNGIPVDATWVDDRTVAVLTRSSDLTPVTIIEVGGPSAPLGQLEDATAIVGGNNGTVGLRVLRATGEIWKTQGGGWVSTGVTASFIATKQ